MTAGTTPTAPTLVYDMTGVSYNTARCADPRLEQIIWAALGDSKTVLNVGAGTGAYLDPAVRAGISMLAQTEHQRSDGLTRLRRDLDNSTWAARHVTLLDQTAHDCGYRLIIAGVSR